MSRHTFLPQRNARLFISLKKKNTLHEAKNGTNVTHKNRLIRNSNIYIQGIFMKKLNLFLLAGIFLIGGYIHPQAKAADWQNFKADNYHNLTDDENATENLKQLIQKDTVFLMVTGCYLDGEAMPAYVRMAQKYPKATFIRIDQHKSTKDFMLKNYLSSGAPKMYVFADKSLVGQLFGKYEFKNGKRKFLGWDHSVTDYIDTLYPVVSEMNDLKNVQGISSFSDSKIEKQRLVMLRINSKNPQMIKKVELLLKVAKKHPDKKFVISRNELEYDQPFSYRYRKQFNAVSVIENGKAYASLRWFKFNTVGELDKWLIENYSNKTLLQPGPGSIATATELANAIKNLQSSAIATAEPLAIREYNKSLTRVNRSQFRKIFYVVYNALTDSQLKKATATELVELLSFKNAGGIKKIQPVKILRKKVYAIWLHKAADLQTDPEVKQSLQNLAQEI